MAFGDDRSMAPYKNDHRVEIHGTGYSKIIFGDDQADNWEKYLDLMVEAVAANGGRACVNAQRDLDAAGTPTPSRRAWRSGWPAVKARPWDDPNCEVSAFAKPEVAEAINNMVDEGLKTPGARDVTQELRGTPRLVKDGPVRVAAADDHPLRHARNTRWRTRSSCSPTPA